MKEKALHISLWLTAAVAPVYTLLHLLSHLFGIAHPH